MKNINAKFIVSATVAVGIIAFVIHSPLHKEDSSITSRSIKESKEMRSMQLILSGGHGLDLPNYHGTDIETALKALKRKNFIRDVVIEKKVVCAGEDFEVRVLLENQDGQDSDLVCRLGDKFSNVAVFNYLVPGDQVIDIYVRDQLGNVDVRNLAISVIDCPEKAALFINANPSDKKAEEIEFAIIEKRGIECPCTYEWEFGDGAVQHTAEENISHNYGKRPQDTFSSTFIVSVKASDKYGKKTITRTSITLINTRFVSKQIGFAVVPIIYDTRLEFVDNAYSTQVKIKNIYDDPITFNEATILIKSVATNEIVEQETVSAGSIMKKLDVRSGEIVEDVISIPSRLVPESGYIIQITLVGTFPDNTSGKGMIFLFKE